MARGRLRPSAILTTVFAALLIKTATADQRGPARPSPTVDVTMSGGATHSVTDVKIFRRAYPGGSFYTRNQSYSLETLPIHVGDAVLLKLPLGSVRRVAIVREPNKVNQALVTMGDGTQLKGYLRDPSESNERPVDRLTGRTVVEGFSATLNLSIAEVELIDVSGSSPTPSLAVTQTGGKVTSPVTGVKFEIDPGDSRSSSSEVAAISVTTGALTVEVPLIEIGEISKDQETITVRTIAGKTLTGRAGSDFLRGKTTAFGRPANVHLWIGAAERLVFRR